MTDILGTSGSDNLVGTAGNDMIASGWGNDIVIAGDGDDVIEDNGGDNNLSGGSGNDYIRLSSTYLSLSGNPLTDASRVRRSNLISAGDGNDFVNVDSRAPGQINIDLGAGDDLLLIGQGGGYFANTNITLGAGQDRVLFGFALGDAYRATLTPPAITIADFTTGDGGDAIDLSSLLRGLLAFTTVAQNPFASGHLVLVQSGADTIIRVDVDGAGPGTGGVYFRDVIRLTGVSASQLTAFNLGGYAPNGAAPTSTTITGTADADHLAAGVGGSTINALGGNDRVLGGAGTDMLDGGSGNDIIEGGLGDDIVRGGEGNDTLTDGAGNDVFEGGDGDDVIDIFRLGSVLSATFLSETVSIDAGEGNDFVRFELGPATSGETRRTVNLSINLGGGNDRLVLPRVIADTAVTLGAGTDRVVLGSQYLIGRGNESPGLLPPMRILDFAAGDDGDVLELDRMLSVSSGWNGLTNPFASGHLSLVQSGADTIVRWDYDGNGPGTSSTYTIVRLVNVNAASLTAFNFSGYNPDRSASSYVMAGGTPGNDVLYGSNAGDIIDGGDGDDRIEERKAGSDVLIGGNGNDTIIVAHEFAPAPETITINAGAGDDNVSFSVNESSGQPIGFVADLGSGNDRLTLFSMPQNGGTITLGAGQDLVAIGSGLASERVTRVAITDFATGDNGDRLDFYAFITAKVREGSVDFNPFRTGQARLIQEGADTLLQFRETPLADRDENLEVYSTLVVFRNTSVASFTNFNFGMEIYNNPIRGTAGNDIISGDTGLNTLLGFAGSDELNGLGGNDLIRGGDGNDTINGGDGDDWLEGGNGVDTLIGGAGNDTLNGGALSDTVYGDDGDDLITDRSGGDTIFGGAGNDIINSLVSGSAIYAGDGNDLLNIVSAFRSSWTVDMGAGDDRIAADGLFGRVTLGAGRDSIEFPFIGPRGQAMTITDFETGDLGDSFDLRGLLSWTSSNNPFESGNVELRQVGNNVELFHIPNITGQFPPTRLAIFENTVVSAFTAANFGGFEPAVAGNSPVIMASSRIVAAGSTVARVNVLPFEWQGTLASAAYLFSDSGSNAVQLINRGTVTNTVSAGGYGVPVGMLVTSFVNPASRFHNASDGTFITSLIANFGASERVFTTIYGFLAPGPTISFTNDGRFEVNTLNGTAIGVVSGYDPFGTRAVTNNGTFIVTSADYDAIGFRLGFNGGFANTGTIQVTAAEVAVGVIFTQFSGTPVVNDGTIIASRSKSSRFETIGIVVQQVAPSTSGNPFYYSNAGTITADIAFYCDDRANPQLSINDILTNTGTLNGDVIMGRGNDRVINNGAINGDVLLGEGDDIYDGANGTQSLAIFGEAGNDRLTGGAGNDDLVGGFGDDVLSGGAGDDILEAGDGVDEAIGGAGNDVFIFGASLTAADTIDGGSGADQFGISGNYTGANALTLGATTMTNIEVLACLPGAGNGYEVSINDGNVAAGAGLTVFAGNLGAGQNFTLNGSAENDGFFRTFGGLGTDTIIGGQQSDGFYFGANKWQPGDTVNGGGGTNDQLALDGDYTITIGNGADVEVLVLLAGPTSAPDNIFNITLADQWAPTGASRTVFARNNRIGVVINGAGESGANLTIFGGRGNDTLTTGGGNDIIYGLEGDDLITGGSSAGDVAVYQGTRATYSVVTNSGSVQIVDNDAVTDNNDGTDTVVGIEFARFSDQTISITSPIILDLDGGGVETLSASASTASYDMDGDGIGDDTSWFGTGEGLLFLDRNGDGTLSDAGEFSFTNDVPGARSDLEGLAAFDSNGDGQLSAADAQFASFGVWQDRNGDGVVDAGEVTTLAGAGVASISLTGTANNATTALGDVAVVNTGSFIRTDGRAGGFIDAVLTAFASSGGPASTTPPGTPTAQPVIDPGLITGSFADAVERLSPSAPVQHPLPVVDAMLAERDSGDTGPLGRLGTATATNAGPRLDNRVLLLTQNIAAFGPTSASSRERWNHDVPKTMDVFVA